MQNESRIAWRHNAWGSKALFEKTPRTKAERERKKRLAEIGAAVVRMKLRAEGRLK